MDDDYGSQFPSGQSRAGVLSVAHGVQALRIIIVIEVLGQFEAGLFQVGKAGPTVQ